MESVPFGISHKPDDQRNRQDSNLVPFSNSGDPALNARLKIGQSANVTPSPTEPTIPQTLTLDQQIARVLSLKQIASLDSHQAEIKDFILSHSDNMLISADISGYIYFWSTLNNQVTFKYRQHANKRLVCFFKTHLKHSIGVHNSEGDISCFSVNHKVYHNPKYFKPNCSSILMTKTPYKCFVVGTNSGEVLIHQINTNDTVGLQAHRAQINGFVTTAEGLIYSISDDRDILVICLREKVIKGKLRGHRDRITGICHIPELGLIVTVGADSMINIWNLRSHTLQKVIHFPKPIVGVGVLSDVNFLVIGTSSSIFILDWKRESIVRKVETLCDKLVVDIFQRRIYAGHGKKIAIFKIPKNQKLLIEPGVLIEPLGSRLTMKVPLTVPSDIGSIPSSMFHRYPAKDPAKAVINPIQSRNDTQTKESLSDFSQNMYTQAPASIIYTGSNNLKRVKESGLSGELSSRNSELASTNSQRVSVRIEADTQAQKLSEVEPFVKPIAQIKISPSLSLPMPALKPANDVLNDRLDHVNPPSLEFKVSKGKPEEFQDQSDPKHLTIRLPTLFNKNNQSTQNLNDLPKTQIEDSKKNESFENDDVRELARENFLSQSELHKPSTFDRIPNLGDQKNQNLPLFHAPNPEIQSEFKNENLANIELKKRSYMINGNDSNWRHSTNHPGSLFPQENSRYFSQVQQVSQGPLPAYFSGQPTNIIRHAATEKEAIFLGTCLLCQEMKIRTLYDTQGRAYKLIKGETSYYALGICPQYNGAACIMFSDNSSCELKIMNLHFSPEQTSKSFVFYFGPEHKRYTLIWCPKNRLFRDVDDSTVFFYIDPCRGRVARYHFK